MWKKWSDQKEKVNFEIFDVTTSLTNNCNISRSKDNQTIKFGQSMEYKQKDIFLQKSCKK